MKLFARKMRIGWLVFAFAAAVLILLPGKAVVQEDTLHKAEVPQINLPTAADKGDPKMDYALNKFLKIFYTEGLDKAKEFARLRQMDLEDDMIRVVVEANPTGYATQTRTLVNIVMDRVRALGGKVETFYEELVQCFVPYTALQTLAASSLVKYVRLPLRPYTMAVTSEGVALTGANLWHSLEPYRNTSGEPKVCILDLGFKNYSALLGTELPSSVTTRSFRANGDISAGQVHGTACAEIVYDMMPDAKFYLVNFNTEVEQHNAVNWLISEGVDVISYSIGWYNSGDGAGNGPITEDVKKAYNNGIVWVGAAGNEAEDHWTATFSDGDNDRWHNFSGIDEILNFYVPSYTLVACWLNWDDWGTWSGTSFSGSRQDYDLWLWIWWGGAWWFVDASENWQTGTQWPVESIGYWYSSASTYWGVSIYNWYTTRNCKLELFTTGNSSAIEYNQPEGSLIVPADSPYGVAVGATDAITDAYHTYSSRGPTHDGRIKPDFCAPSGVSVSGSTYGPRAAAGLAGGFYGTSAATPHMAGAFVLLKGKTPFSLDEIQTILKKRAKDLGPGGMDNQYGIGRLNLKK